MSKIEIINTLINEVPESQLPDIIDFLLYLRLKNDRAAIKDIEAAGISSTGFWDNPDDEAWDHV